MAKRNPRRRKFDISGTTYEVRAAPFPNGWHVQCFKEGKAVGARYGIEWDTAWDFRVYTGADPVEELMGIAERDLRAHIEHGEFNG